MKIVRKDPYKPIKIPQNGFYILYGGKPKMTKEVKEAVRLGWDRTTLDKYKK
jgi:hypothetical protein